MKKKISAIYQKVPSWLKNRYFLSAIIFTIWIFLFDTNSVLFQINQKKEKTKIVSDIEYYKNEIQKDEKLINVLSSDSLTPDLERYLREVLFLSKKNEEVFIIK